MVQSWYGGRKASDAGIYQCFKKQNKQKTVNDWHISLFTSPWYNRTGWLGVKHQLTYLLIIYNRKRYFRTDSLTRIPYKIKEQLIRSQACLNHLFEAQ